MFCTKHLKSGLCTGVLFLAFCLLTFSRTASAQGSDSQMYSPVVNGVALRGLSNVGSAEPMGEGRITFGIGTPWYQQQNGYLTSPNSGANIYTFTGAFSYGVNSYVDLFGSVTGFTSNHYTNTDNSSGLGTIRAGVQGSLPIPISSVLRIGGQTAIIGGTSQNQINTYRADGYNYFDTRTEYAFMGKILQTIQFGTEDLGIKAHLNEAAVMGIINNQPVLLLLSAAVQGNINFAVIGAELNSRIQFNSVSFSTDPLWFTPSLTIRTPFGMNGMAGADIALSEDRTGGKPRALEPYRIFGTFAFSLDALAGKRREEAARKEKDAQEKLAMERNAVLAANKVDALTEKSKNDSINLFNEQERARAQMSIMQENAEVMSEQASIDSAALAQAAEALALEKEKRSEAENKLLETGELLLDAVYFETNGTELSINSKPYLNIIGKMLLKYPKLQIEVAGHTDNIGEVDYNLTLSQGRADAVHDYLVQIAPGLQEYLSAKGYGMSMPTADNGTKEGRQANRRVELQVLNKSVLPEYNSVGQ